VDLDWLWVMCRFSSVETASFSSKPLNPAQ
jgi:hypothetical protein